MNAIKPALTYNKFERLGWKLSHIQPQSIESNVDSFRYLPMYNTVHVDEKWFFLSETSGKYYLAPKETRPYRTCKSKRFIGKVMFLVAIARSRFNSDGNCTFDGKIGVFPFVETVNAIRSSANRPRGTPEIKPIQSITKEIIKH